MSTIIKTEPLSFPWNTRDPFLFCAYHNDHYPAGNEKFEAPLEERKKRFLGQDFDPNQPWRMYHGETVPGFPAHPHRGFETVTIATKGLIDHSDSLGASGRFGNGDVQWMTAGKGVQHSEMFPLLNQEKENPLELFQIWLNLPRASKQVEPHYKMLWAEDIPKYVSDSAKVEVIAGDFGDTQALSPAPDSWAADPKNGVAIWLIEIQPGGELELPPSTIEGVNRTLFFYNGSSMEIADQPIAGQTIIDLKPDKTTVLKAKNDTVHLVLMQGKPIGEPVVQHGPFVVNEQHEIMTTIQEYQRTQFGGWPWPKADQVHDGGLGRFAKHADGREEIPG